MKTLGLVLAMALLMCGSAYAATATIDLYPVWQTVSCPIVPFDPRPAGPIGVQSGVFEPLMWWDMGIPVLMRWDAVASPQGWVTYNYNFGDGLDPVFGNILLGEGYMFNPGPVGSPEQIVVTGVPSGVPDGMGNKTDMWISLPRTGWSLIGVPYAEDLVVDQLTGDPIYFTDGLTLKDWLNAASDPGAWVSPTALEYDPVQGRYVSVGIMWAADTDTFYAGMGYFIEVKQDNIAMIIEAPP